MGDQMTQRPVDRLDEILDGLYYEPVAGEKSLTIIEGRKAILDLFKKMVPRESKDYSVGTTFAYAWDKCREEMLKKLEEMR